MSSSVGEGGEGLVAAAGLKRKEVPGEVEGEEEEELLLPEKEDGSGGEDATSSGALLKTDAHWWQKKGARDISEYKILGPIGEGAYGIVWKAKQPGTGDLVALKMIKTSDTGGGSSSATSATASSRVEVNEMGFPLTSVREIRILKLLNHRNVVQLKEVC
jgi:serine/threonine protein kinase